MFQEKVLDVLIKLCRLNFGAFERAEFKKFFRMGLIFCIMMGVYWTLKPLKDSIFIQLVGAIYLPYAKTVSVISLLPLVMFYTKLLERTSRERMLVILPTFYGIITLLFGVAMFFAQGPEEEIAARLWIPFLLTKGLGYFWYFFVESFGSLMVALFWAFATDTTEPPSAKKGFPLVVAIGAVGGIVCPYSIAGLPYRLGLETDAFSLLFLGFLTIGIVPLVRYFLRVTPASMLHSFASHREDDQELYKKSGFLEGLKLMVSHRYLLGIFTVNFIYETIVTIFDFNFKVAAGAQYQGVALSHYLSIYGSSVNVVSLVCLLLGISNVTRFLGVGVALVVMPLLVTGALVSFLTVDSLSFLFYLMVGSKALNYALNGPALKQLYIPTSKNMRFKAQAWIETFGARGAKEAASLFNMTLKPLQNAFGELAGRSHYLTLSGVVGFPLLGLWLVTALYLGRQFRRAIQEKKQVQDLT